MRSKWFGDKRDIVKWSTLLHLAARHNLKQIVQICFLNPYDFPAVTIDGIEVPVPNEVIAHFRDVHSVQRISNQVTVSIFDKSFEDRKAYLLSAIAFIARNEDSKCVFLDPDTGLAPKKADIKHVTESEVAAFWQTLRLGDVLALYQHQTNRRGTPWIADKQRQLAEAINLPISDIKVAKAEKIANDVAFFHVMKVYP